MKILIVDDERLVRLSLGRAFRAKGHKVTEASDGNEGLVRWLEMQAAGQGPDVVFLDVLMPGLSGPELLKKMRDEKVRERDVRAETDRDEKIDSDEPKLGERNDDAKVVLMSAYSGEHKLGAPQEIAEQMGADRFVPKPFDDVFAIVQLAEELMR